MRRLAATSLLAAGLISTGVGGAASPPTRDDYVKTAEAICKPYQPRLNSLARKSNTEFNEGHFDAAGTAIRKASALIDQEIGRVAALPRPLEGRARLSRFFPLYFDAVRLLDQVGVAEQKGRIVLAKKLAFKSYKGNIRASKVVTGFGFKYCV